MHSGGSGALDKPLTCCSYLGVCDFEQQDPKRTETMLLWTDDQSGAAAASCIRKLLCVALGSDLVAEHAMHL